MKRVQTYKANKPLQSASKEFFNQIGIGSADYVYNFFWLGVPIIQIPQDLQAMQEIIWEVKPDLIIETGIAWGGSVIFSASMLTILEACKCIRNGLVVGIDIEIRPHNKKAIRAHPLGGKITMIEGSSIDKEIIKKVYTLAKGKKHVLVCLDSNHTHDHVLAELRAYGPLVSKNSYCIVGDTSIEYAPQSMVAHRPWGKGNSPRSAIMKFLRENRKFKIDSFVDTKLVLTGLPDGYLKRIR